MATLRDIRSRIKGVRNTQKITKAMKMVAAAKLRRAQENILNARPYARKISEILSDLVTEDQRQTNPYLQAPSGNNVLVVVVTADRGLCGTFNTNIIKEAQNLIDVELKKAGKEVSLFCVGKKGNDFFSKRHYNVIGCKIGAFSKLSFDTALGTANEIIQSFLSGTFGEVHIVYNEFKSVVSQKVVVTQFLPVPAISSDGVEKAETNFIYEKDQKSIFEYTLPKYLRAQMWKVFLESTASEFGARMTAMDNATTNAGDLIRTLSITYNKARQAAITTEILEIVSGANALKESNN
ncbi:MAG: ATP synthase F1 subunit gamma [Ignavibacteriales bacterium]|nr:ATP synthase F1 subunit gamma [Ignavibacteriales bacterium]